MKSVKVVLRNYQTGETIDYNIVPKQNQLAQDWMNSLEQDILKPNLHLEKNYCFHGFPHTQRTLEYLCKQLNKHIYTINTSEIDYNIEEYFTPDVVRYGKEYPIGYLRDNKHNWGLKLKHDVMNKLHNHFEVLQGTVEHPSVYAEQMTPVTTYAVRQLNNICHEIESLCLSQRKLHTDPQWVRPSQITTFLKAPRHNLTDEHRQGFLENSYDRILGGVYMHWCQIGKTLMEVYRDEGAPVLTDTVCEAITHLQYYSGEFDIEWGNDVMYDMRSPWHCAEIDGFENWLKLNNHDPSDPKLSLGYLKIGQIDLKSAFGSELATDVWTKMGDYLDIYQIECGNTTATYNYHWSNTDHEQQQLGALA